MVLRVTLVLFLLGCVGSVVAYRYMTSSARVVDLARKLITDLTAAQVHIESASFALQGPVQLNHVTLRLPGMDGPEGLLFEARSVMITHDPWALLDGRFEARSVVFDQPTFHITDMASMDTPDGVQLSNLQLMLAIKARQPPKPSEPLRTLPEIFLDGARVHLARSVDGQLEDQATIGLSGSVTAQPTDISAYRFVLYKTQTDQPGPLAAPQTPGEMLSGTFNLRRGTIEARLVHLQPDSQLFRLLPEKYRRWWESLEPTGQVPPVLVGFDPDPAVGLYAEMEIRDVALTLPFEGYRSRMTDVDGRITILGNTINIAALDGEIEGFHYSVSGQVRGLSTDAPFQLAARIRGTLPENPRYLFALPQPVQRNFSRFLPSGSFNGFIQLERPARNSDDAPDKQPELAYSGQVTIGAGRITYEKHPYPLHDVRGVFKFTNEQVRIVELTGKGPTGGSTHITGTIEPPGDGAEVNIRIKARDLPIDEQLYGALEPAHRNMIAAFLHQPSYDALTEAGLIQTDTLHSTHQQQLDQHLAELAATTDAAHRATLQAQIDSLRDKVARPTFTMGGRVNVDIDVHRPAGQGQRYATTAVIELAGIDIVSKFFPYPMQLKAGRLTVAPGVAIVDGLVADGLTGGEIRIDGRSELNKAPVKDRPDLRIVTRNLPLDDFLLHCIKSPQDIWIRELHLTGHVNATGRIHTEDTPDAPLTFAFDADLINATAQPYRGRYRLDDLAGKLHITPHGVSLRDITARHDESTLKLVGDIRWHRDDRLTDVTLTGKNLRFEDPVLDLLSKDEAGIAALRELEAKHKPTGLYDGSVHLRVRGDEPSTFELQVHPTTIDFDLHKHRLKLRDMAGHVKATRGRVELVDIAARTDEGRVENVRGSIAFGESPRIDVAFDMHAGQIGADTRSILPSALLDTIDKLKITGAYAAKDARLIHSPGATEGHVTDFQGRIDLLDGSAVLGLPITDIKAQLNVDIKQKPGQTWPLLNVRVSADALRVAERLVGPLSVDLITSERNDVVGIRKLEGKCYTGVLVGEGWLKLGEQNRYHVDLTLQDAALEPFIKPADDADWLKRHREAGEKRTTTGLISANLTLEGVTDDNTSRRGRGAVRVRDAKLYNVPVALAVLQLANLNLPVDSAFDRAEADYLIVGNQVQLDHVAIEARNTRIVGRGTMGFEDLKLDLRMVSRSPGNRKALGDVADLLDVFKDELLSFHVTGTLDDPKARVQTLKGIKGSLDEILRGNRLEDPKAPVTQGRAD